MNLTMVERVTTTTFSIHLQGGELMLSSGQERRAGLLFPDGLWQQQTLPVHGPKPSVPKHFATAWPLWRRFVAKMGITHFELSCSLCTVRRLSPAPLFVRQLPEWRLHAEIPRDGASPLVFSRSLRAKSLPSRALMARIRAMSRPPAVIEAVFAAEPIYVPGDLLLDWLSSALDHLPERPVANGRWLAQRGPGGWSAMDAELESDTYQHNAFSAIPERYRFVPHQIFPEPQGIFKAVCYDSASGSLTCKKGEQWRIFVVDQPLYRLFGTARFTTRRHDSVIKGNRVSMPSAILFPKR